MLVDISTARKGWRGSFSSARETTPSWNSAGVASRYTPSFFAAVAGFIVWVLWCDVMPSSVSSVRRASDHGHRPRPDGGGSVASRPLTWAGNLAG